MELQTIITCAKTAFSCLEEFFTLWFLSAENHIWNNNFCQKTLLQLVGRTEMKTLNPLAETQCRFAMSPKFGCRYTLKEIFESLTNLRLSSRGYSRLVGKPTLEWLNSKWAHFSPTLIAQAGKKRGKRGLGGGVN